MLFLDRWLLWEGYKEDIRVADTATPTRPNNHSELNR